MEPLPEQGWAEVVEQRGEEGFMTLKNLIIRAPRVKRPRPEEKGQGEEGGRAEGQAGGVEETLGRPLALDDPRARALMAEAVNDTSGFLHQKRGSINPRQKRKDVNVLWMPYETDKFYDALRLFGSDFSLMKTRFANRDRKSLKAKFHKEEKADQEAITWALLHDLGVPDDIDPFQLPFPSQLRGWDQQTLREYHEDLIKRLEEKYPEQLFARENSRE